MLKLHSKNLKFIFVSSTINLLILFSTFLFVVNKFFYLIFPLSIIGLSLFSLLYAKLSTAFLLAIVFNIPFLFWLLIYYLKSSLYKNEWLKLRKRFNIYLLSYILYLFLNLLTFKLIQHSILIQDSNRLDILNININIYTSYLWAIIWITMFMQIIIFLNYLFNFQIYRFIYYSIAFILGSLFYFNSLEQLLGGIIFILIQIEIFYFSLNIQFNI